MQRTASKAATDVAHVCHGRSGCVAVTAGLRQLLSCSPSLMQRIFHSSLLAITCSLLAVLPAHADVAAFRRDDAAVDLSEHRTVQAQRLAIALLTSSTYEAPPEIATPERWDEALRRSHLRVTFAEPRSVSFRFSTIGPPKSRRRFPVEELLIPLAPADYALVRSHGRVRAFAKFSCESLTALRHALELPHE